MLKTNYSINKQSISFFKQTYFIKVEHFVNIFQFISLKIILIYNNKHIQQKKKIIKNWHSMQQRLDFYPDIQTKFDHLITHMSDKNNVTLELVKILKDVCNLELFYSSSLDKFANAVSKLFLGNDPIKDVLIILQRIISVKQQQSQKLAKQIKDDLIPHIQSSINVKAQQQLRDKSNDVRNIRASMQRKIRTLFTSEANFKRAVLQVNNLPKVIQYNQKQKALQIYRKKQDQFSDTIDSYNSSLNDYMIKYSQICQQFLQAQTKRMSQYRDALTKLVIFQIDYIKNLEYNLRRYMSSLEKMEGKFSIQDQGLDTGQAFYQTKDSGMVHLGKISNKNYIDSVVGKKKVNESLLSQQIKVTELKATYRPGSIPKQTYHSLVKTILPIMNFIHKNNHTNLLIEVVLFSKQVYTSKGDLKLTLLNSLICHQIFYDEKFWIDYEKRLHDKITRQQNLNTGDQKILHNNFNNVLDRDISMLQSVQINPYISKVIRSVCQRAKLSIYPPLALQGINNQNSINQKSLNTAKILKSALKYKIFE